MSTAKRFNGEIKISSSLLDRAINNDSEALSTMFRQFVPEKERIYYTQYLGRKGLWRIGMHSFACLTDCRVADISVGAFGEVIYQDGYLEFINSSVIYQPSKLLLYILFIFWLSLIFIFLSSIYNFIYYWIYNDFISVLISLIVSLLFLLLTPFIVKIYYSFVKCGIVFWVREGVPIYIFSNRKYLTRANILCREVTICREKRIRKIKEKIGLETF